MKTSTAPPSRPTKLAITAAITIAAILILAAPARAQHTATITWTNSVDTPQTNVYRAAGQCPSTAPTGFTKLNSTPVTTGTFANSAPLRGGRGRRRGFGRRSWLVPLTMPILLRLHGLNNYVQDCRACQLQLTAAKQNATDDAAKIRALTRERDAAVTAAKGGSLWLRLKRNAHWLAIGAAVGAVTSVAALCHTGHCR